LEYPFDRVFHRIAKVRFGKRGSFEDALEKADLWRFLEGYVNFGGWLGGVVGTIGWPILGPLVVAPLLGVLAGGNFFQIARGVLDPTMSARLGSGLGRTLAILGQSSVFDMWDADAWSEVALEHLLDKLPADPEQKFAVAMNIMPLARGYARGFRPSLP
jgi:hypothetical protein